MDEYKNLKYHRLQKDGRVALLTLDRPEKRNALNPEVWAEMNVCRELISEMDDVGAVVIAGAGKHFSAGIDTDFLGEVDPQYTMKNLAKFQALYTAWEDFPAPVIASVQGVCLGNAAEFVLACDLRIAARSAKFAFLEVKVGGISPDFGGTTRLPRLVGPGQARRLIYTGEQIDAAEAYRIGLIEYITDDDQLEAETMRLAKEIASRPPLGIYMAKKGLLAAGEGSRTASLLFEQAQSIFCCGTADQKEAASAAMEGRAPHFQGK